MGAHVKNKKFFLAPQIINAWKNKVDLYDEEHKKKLLSFLIQTLTDGLTKSYAIHKPPIEYKIEKNIRKHVMGDIYDDILTIYDDSLLLKGKSGFVIGCEAIQLGSIFQIGKYHLEKKILCQDRAVAVEKDGLKIIILSDGMGSYKYTDIGALFVINYILEKANGLYKLLDAQGFDDEGEPIWAEADEGKTFAQGFSSLLLQMEAEAKEYAKRIGATIDQLHCTLSFVIVGVDKVLAAAIGDSPIWIKCKSKEGIDVLDGNDGAEKGTFSAMNLELSLNYMAVAIFPASDLRAVLMMSDGCFGYDKEQIYDPSEVKDFPDWFYAVIRGKRNLQAAINQLCKKGHDDCSFAYYVHGL